MKQWLSTCLWTMALICSLSGCDVHEFPEPGERASFVLHLQFNTQWEMMEEVLTKQRSTQPRDIRYIVKAFPLDAKNRAIYAPSETFTFLRSAREGYDCTVTLDLPVGRYHIRIWADLVEPGNTKGLFYNANDFARISLQGVHCGNTDDRDAFRGSCPIEVVTSINETQPTEYTVEMIRPLAKFEFITTDLEEFIDKATQDAQAKAEAEAKKNGQESTEGGSRGENTRADVDDYKVVFYYTGFMPNVFSHITDKPVDSATGIFFTSSIKPLNETDASLGFDYVFINSRATTVAVAVGLFDIDGNRVAMSNPVNVPIRRSYHTIVRGRFLTQRTSGGIVIDPGFDDEFNVVLP